VGGILLAYPLEVPCGAMIVMTCIGIFVATLIFGRLRPRRSEGAGT